MTSDMVRYRYLPAGLLLLFFPVAKGAVLAVVLGIFFWSRYKNTPPMMLPELSKPALVMLAAALAYGVLFSVLPERSLREALSILPALLGAWAVLQFARLPEPQLTDSLWRAVLLVVAVTMTGFLYWQVVAGPFVYRVEGIQLLSTRNLHSGVLAFAFVAAAATHLSGAGAGRLPRLLIPLAVVLLGLLMIANNTRGALLGSVAALFVMLMFSWRVWKILVLLAAFGLGMAVVWLIMPDWPYRIGLSRGGDFTSFRLALWETTWNLIQVRPWTGYGIGVFKHAPEINAALPDGVRFQPSPHNWLLEWLLSLGIVGSICFTAAIAGLWRSLRRSKVLAHNSSLCGLLGTGLLTFVLVNGLVDFRAFGVFFLTTAFAAGALVATWHRASVATNVPGGSAARDA